MTCCVGVSCVVSGTLAANRTLRFNETISVISLQLSVV